ncbi:hypothetical protein OY671_008428, partial [Metschnikowia pulcherrima]
MGSTVEVFTVGGGEYLVNVFNAIAAWSSAGGYRASSRVVMAMGFAMASMTTAWNMASRPSTRWSMQATLMHTSSLSSPFRVKATDLTNPGLAPPAVANVPIRLAGTAPLPIPIAAY